MSDYEKPNLSIPLANSYNERGINGYTSTITSGIDQRKLNLIYEPVNNAITGRSTLYTTKRPGIAVSVNALGSLSSGVGAIPYLMTSLLGTPPSTTNSPCSIDKTPSSGRFTSNFGAGTFTIFTESAGAGYYPTYVDTTLISGVRNVVVQFRDQSAWTVGPSRTWYSTNLTSWTEITDSVFTALTLAGKIEHLGGFAFVMGADNYIYNSDLNSISSWPANNRIQKSIQTDIAAGLAKLGGVLLSFGRESVEGWINNGNPSGSVLASRPDLATNIGLAMNAGGTTDTRHYSAVESKILYFLGTQTGPGAAVSLFAFNGQSFEKVSTPFIDKILSNQVARHVQRFDVLGRVAIAISMSATSDTPQRWLMYFPVWKEWFEWTSTFIQPVSEGANYLGIGGSQYFNSAGGLFVSNGWTDAVSASYGMAVQFMLPKTSNGRKFMSWAAVEADTVNASLLVEASDNDYSSFATIGIIDLNSRAKRIDRLGSYQNRAIRLSNSENKEIRLEKFLARIK